MESSSDVSTSDETAPFPTFLNFLESIFTEEGVFDFLHHVVEIIQEVSQSPPPEEIRYCTHFIERLGRHCQKRVSHESDFCWLHDPAKVQARNQKRRGTRLPRVRKPRKLAQLQTTIEEDCPVCYEKTHDQLLCRHYVHRGCVVLSGQARCPVCRAPVQIEPSERTRFNQAQQEFRSHLNDLNDEMLGPMQPWHAFEIVIEALPWIRGEG